ncbi:MAG: hypothetical protein ACQEUZ_04375 [Pseudomonadota bacterium]
MAERLDFTNVPRPVARAIRTVAAAAAVEGVYVRLPDGSAAPVRRREPLEALASVLAQMFWMRGATLAEIPNLVGAQFPGAEPWKARQCWLRVSMDRNGRVIFRGPVFFGDGDPRPRNAEQARGLVEGIFMAEPDLGGVIETWPVHALPPSVGRGDAG